MKKNIASIITVVILLSLSLPFRPTVAKADAIIADHRAVGRFEQIPQSVIEQVKAKYRIFYGHTSHGSQIVTGMSMLRSENSLYSYNNDAGSLYLSEYGDDLGQLGDTTWVPITRQKLDQGDGINLVIWSWCGGCSDNTEAGINTYLNALDQLEQDYPNVTFIYMTGHLDGTGPAGNLYARNNQIRNYCINNSKILFDFADIESYDPDGNYYPDETDACNWCSIWCSTHTCNTCSDCAHSHCFNCYMKGKVFWWMMAKITGWDLQVEVDSDSRSELPKTFRLNQNFPNPFNPVTSIGYSLSNRSYVNITIYSMFSQKIKIIVDGSRPAGNHTAVWDGTDFAGTPVSSGLYLYQINTGQFTDTRKMVLLR